MLSNYIAIICLTFTIGSCDKDVAPAVQRLVGIEDRNGLLLMSFDYDACDMVGIQYFEPLIVNTAPVQYPDPINENKAASVSSAVMKAVYCASSASTIDFGMAPPGAGRTPPPTLKSDCRS